MQYDVILCSLGTRYSMYCATCARTYLVDPSKQQEQEYGALLAAQQAALQALIPGVPLSSVHQAVVGTLQVREESQVLSPCSLCVCVLSRRRASAACWASCPRAWAAALPMMLSPPQACIPVVLGRLTSSGSTLPHVTEVDRL